MTDFNNTHLSFDGHSHDHKTCVSEALKSARSLCETRGARLTPIRQQVLELIWNCHKPVGAYDLLASLSKDGEKVAPPTVYRALDFLLEQGLIHRIESLNAYVGCPHPETEHSSLFLICRTCQHAAEVHDQRLFQKLSDTIAGIGFAQEQQVLEIRGICPDCQKADRS
ncbi:Fur family transcriptional regulator [Kiloniella sp. b19]|uniref:Fur family transcriptional regulator n=1 Tax=Kiloniella sp. GXU_MW_B19 TaxID=3141326 RepID=UPI0031DE8498